VCDRGARGGGIVECFRACHGPCVGLRWGEGDRSSSGNDVELPADDDPGWLVVRRTYRPHFGPVVWIPTRTRSGGPLKGPGSGLRVAGFPVPPLLVTKASAPLGSSFGEGPSRTCLFIAAADLSTTTCFGRHVWDPARSTVLSSTRRSAARWTPRQPRFVHGSNDMTLRHAALFHGGFREGVDARRLSALVGVIERSRCFLDIYKGRRSRDGRDDGVETTRFGASKS
jgi:hypothetical protein